MDPLLFSIALLSLTTLLILLKLRAKTTQTTKLLPPSPPFRLPLLGHLHLLQKPLHLSLSRLSSRHGPLLLVHFGSRPVIIISSLPIARTCFSSEPTTDLALASRPQLPSAKNLTYNYTALGAAPYGPHWRNARRIATLHLLSAHRLQLLSYIRQNEAETLVSRLFSEDSKKVELKSRLFGLAFNIIMRMIAGKRYYGEEGDEEAAKFREMVEQLLLMVGVSNASDFVPVLRWVDFGGVRRKMGRLVAKREVMLQKLIDEGKRKRKESGREEKKAGDLIGVLLGFQEEDPEYYTDTLIKSLIVTLLFAGTDTSTDTIEWAMSFLANHPDSLRIAQTEIDSVVGNRRLLEEDDLPNLPYLQSIISETLRLCPAAPLLVPHESIQDCTIEGYTVPRGTILLVNAWAIHRDPAIWTDPAEFRPERFLNEEKSSKSIIPFGLGRRRCPGDGLAGKVIGLVLGMLVQCFEWERIGEEMVDMRGGAGLTLHKVVPLELAYRPRESMINVLSQI